MVAWATTVPGAAGSSWWARCSCVLGVCSSTIDVAAPPPPVRLEPQLGLEVHQAPDLDAVRLDVGLDCPGSAKSGVVGHDSTGQEALNSTHRHAEALVLHASFVLLVAPFLLRLVGRR